MGSQGKLSIDPVYPVDSQIPGDRKQISRQAVLQLCACLPLPSPSTGSRVYSSYEHHDLVL